MQLFLSLIWPITVMALIGFASAMLLMLRQNKPVKILLPKNPLDFIAILQLTMLLATFLILVTLAKRYVGEQAVHFITFLGGLVELHIIFLPIILLSDWL